MNRWVVSGLLLSYFYFMSGVACAVDFLLEVGVHSGGDDLRVTNTTQTGAGVNAGDSMSVAAGAVFTPLEHFELQATYGYKYDFDFPIDEVAYFERTELNLLGFYRTNKWRFGGGLTRHLGVNLNAGIVTGTSVEFDDATGSMLEFGYSYTNWGYIGARFTFIEYRTQPAVNVNDVSVSGDSFGVIGGFRF